MPKSTTAPSKSKRASRRRGGKRRERRSRGVADYRKQIVAATIALAFGGLATIATKAIDAWGLWSSPTAGIAHVTVGTETRGQRAQEEGYTLTPDEAERQNELGLRVEARLKING